MPTKIDSIGDMVPDQCTAEIAISSLSELSTRMSPATDSASVSNNINIPQKQCGSEETRFVIPKLSLGSNSSMSPNSVDALTPHEISLKKIMDLKKLHISPVEQENAEPIATANDNAVHFHVDLTKALATEPSDREVDAAKPMESIEYKFVDCELPATKLKRTMANLPRITHECEIDIGNILSERLNNRARYTTAFGKVLCSRFRCTNRPQIKHGFIPKHKIVPFRFDVLNKILPKKTNV